MYPVTKDPESDYPATWGILQIVTGLLSDRWGRKGLIVAGMWIQAAGLFLTAAMRSFEWWLLGSVFSASEQQWFTQPDRGSFRRLPLDVARAVAERLSLLTRSRLRDWRSLRRSYCGPLRALLGHHIDRRPNLFVRSGSRSHYEREVEVSNRDLFAGRLDGLRRSQTMYAGRSLS